MKKIKRWVLAGAVLLICGGLLFTAGMTALGWDFYKLDTTEYTQKSYTVPAEEAESIANVVIDVNSFPVTVRAGERLSLEYYETDDSEIELQCGNGTLTVRERWDAHWFLNGMLRLGRLRHAYVLTLPQNVGLEIAGQNGTIRMSDVQTDKVKIRSSNADVRLTACQVKNLDLEGSNADVEAKDCVLGNVSIDATNAGVEISGGSIDALWIKSTNLDVSVSHATVTSVTVAGTNVDAEFGGVESDEIQLKSTNADYTLMHVSVRALSVQGTNLDAEILIEGIASEYSVESHGSNLPSSRTGTSDKSVYLAGTNNDVSLRFTA